MRSIVPFVALLLSLVSCALRSGTERVEASANPDEQFWQSIEKADVVYVGEMHDDPAHHQYELQLVRGLLKRKMKFAIGWEMFDMTQQGVMDLWASHAIPLEAMLARTDFQEHWGIYSPVYKQILQIAGNASVPNLALNAPPELARKIARWRTINGGREGDDSRPDSLLTKQGYRNFVAMMGDHPGMNETDQRRFFDAQNVWDQTMASRILEFKDREPRIPLMVFTGRGHVSGGYGIPFYVRQKGKLKQIILLPCGRRERVRVGRPPI